MRSWIKCREERECVEAAVRPRPLRATGANSDDRCRLIGEDVYEPEPEKAELFKLAPEDVLTTEESGKLLAPLIKPLPSYDEAVLGKKSVAGA